MIFSDYQGIKISRLAFGTMRLPCHEDKTIDSEQVCEMVDYALANGVNYFDTAVPYHGGMSEIEIGKALGRHPRESFYLATKYPGHQIADEYHPDEIFEMQLKKCNVEYFDFYLLHNVYEKSMPVYQDKRWGIIDYFVEQKRLGRIKHLGFSSHGRPDNLKEFLDYCGDKMEFCQIQLNWLDWTLQEAQKKVELLNARNIPIWVMEPVRGGRLCKLPAGALEYMKAKRPDESIASWSFRWLMNIPGVSVILSGMSNMEQMQDNVKTFSTDKPLTAEENAFLLDSAEKMKKSLPCTGCRYCTDGCPQGLDIPALITALNDINFNPESTQTPAMALQALPADKLPTACIGCGACAAICPQKIDIPAAMQELSGKLNKLPNWAEISKERAEEIKKFQK